MQAVHVCCSSPVLLTATPPNIGMHPTRDKTHP